MLIPSGAGYEAIEIEKIQGPYWKLGFYKSTEVRQCQYLHIVTCDIYELWYPKQALWKCRFTEFIQYIKDHILEVYKQPWWGLVKTILVKVKSWLVKLAHLIYQDLGGRNRRLTNFKNNLLPLWPCPKKNWKMNWNLKKLQMKP